MQCLCADRHSIGSTRHRIFFASRLQWPPFPRGCLQVSSSRSISNDASRSMSSLQVSQPRADVKSDAELARELAAQWEAEDEADRADSQSSRSGRGNGSAPSAAPSKATAKGGRPKEWADDATSTHCFLTNVKFTMVRTRGCRLDSPRRTASGHQGCITLIAGVALR